jgi:hypothetical protein
MIGNGNANSQKENKRGRTNFPLRSSLAELNIPEKPSIMERPSKTGVFVFFIPHKKYDF